MILAILYLSIGLLIGIYATKFLFYLSKENKRKNFRKGLYRKSFMLRSLWKIDVEFEVYEIESSSDLSKIEIIYHTCDSSKYVDQLWKSEILDLIYGINFSWIKTDDIHWLDKSKMDRRNILINKIIK